MRRPRPLVRPLALSALLLACALAPARDGPPAGDPTAIARLRIEPADGEYLAWADNALAGPIEVMLRASSGPPLRSDPPLPARASVPTGSSILVARLRLPAGRSGQLPLSLTAVPGSSNARPRDIEYLPPLQQGERRIDQGFEGAFSHADDENRYALDFAADAGTPVLAARAGTVMQVESAFRAGGLAYDAYASRANLIRILHDDGTMALYAHLARDGVLVRPGEQVRAGQRIGLSGNTGYSTAPHLHFAVQVNRGMRLVAIPFRMRGVSAPRDRGVGRRAPPGEHGAVRQGGKEGGQPADADRQASGTSRDRGPGADQGATSPRRAASNAASARVPTLSLR